MQKHAGQHMDAMDVISAVLLTVVVVLIAFPFYTSLVTSLTTSASYVRNPVQLIPDSFTLENYAYVLGRLNILSGYRNTALVVILGTVMSMLISLTYAYGLSIREYPGKRFAFVFLLITMYFGGGLIPTYMLIRDLKLINNPIAIALLCGVSPFHIIIIKNGIEHLPPSLEEAARMDGAGEWRVFMRVVLPLILPVAVTFTLFSAVGYWNEWYWSIIVLTRPTAKTLQVMLRDVVSTIDAASLESIGSTEGLEVFSQGLKMSAVVITMLPIMIVYPFVQRFFAQGILVGAVKM